RDRIEIVSGDRDLIQLVHDPSVKLLFTLRGVSELLDLDEAGVLEKYGVPASRYLDFAILRGAASDPFPGAEAGPAQGQACAPSASRRERRLRGDDAAAGAGQRGRAGRSMERGARR